MVVQASGLPIDMNSASRMRSIVNRLAILVTGTYLVFVGTIVFSSEGSDFLVYYNAALAFRDGANPYDVPTYTYSPLFVQLLQPLVFFSGPQARLIWFFLQVICLAVLIAVCIRMSGSRYARQYWGLTTLCTFTAMPTYLDLVLGQVGSLMAAFIVTSYMLAQSRPFLASFLLSFSIVIKLYTAVIWFAYVQIQRWKMAYSTIVFCLLLVFVSIAISGQNGYIHFATKLMQGSAYPHTAEHNNSLFGYWLRLFTTNPFVHPLAPMAMLAYLLIAVSIILVILLTWQIGRKAAEAADHAVIFSTWICAMSLITPASGVYNFMILLLPILTLIRVNETHKQKMLSRYLFIVLMLLYMPLMSSLYSIPDLQAQRWIALYFTPPFYGLLILFILLLRTKKFVMSQGKP